MQRRVSASKGRPGSRGHTLSALVLGASALAWANGAMAQPVARVKEGRLEGVASDGVGAFLGVPFAAPPVGARRWRAPDPAPVWGDVRRADRFGPSCVQMVAPQGFGPWTAEYVVQGPVSEDCLYLNVWAPAAPAGASLPVLVWIHGGAFMAGSGSVPIYEGAALARKGVVVVTVNYRLGALGFLAHPELTREAGGSGNYGLLDQVAALRWVRDNIAAFGGDPARVTIAGQSAGAMSVVNLMESPLARGLFARAIAQSGAGLVLPPASLADAERQGLDFARAKGAAGLAELRAMPADKIVAFAMPGPSAGSGAVPALPFAPIRDGRVLPQAEAALADVPLITGLTADEASGFDPTYGKIGQAAFQARVKGQYGEAAADVLGAYASNSDAAASAIALARESGVAATLLWAERRRAEARSPAYLYLYDHAEPGPNAARFGAFHSSEVPYVFQTLGKAQRPFTASDHEIAATMSAYWVNFIKTGDPNGPSLPRWSSHQAGEDQVMGLGDTVGARSPGEAKMGLFRRLRAAGHRLSIF